ncbi:MAG TPA: arginine--tRNA ligase [Candidatus Nanoarchaeia archaeon]|nr:arginine--tRNA ligase [Candidatus Nanoarchaeia archaeon]
MENTKQEISETIKKAISEISKEIKINKKEIKDIIEIPPSLDMGDYSFPCFFLSKKLKKSPDKIALDIRKNIDPDSKEIIKDIQTSGPYINFILDKRIMVTRLFKEIFNDKKEFGQIKTNKEKKPKTMVEFPSPNTNKPLHLGHLRNMAIGESVSRIKEFAGEKVIRTNLNNDRGIHICQSMAAYKLYGKNKTPSKTKKKADHFVGDYYVLFKKNSKKDKSLEKEAQEILQKYEKGEEKTIKLWKKMNKWALEGFKKTYEKFGIKHDKEYFESNLYEKGKDIVKEGVKKGLFEKKENGAVIVNFSEKDLGEKYLLRKDGTSLYITQDIYLAKKKFEEYDLDRSVYVTGDEQKYHFKVLFKLLEMLEISNKNQMEHLAYGMVELPEGKMKSREGTVVDADDLIKETQELVKKELKSRPENKEISQKEIEQRSLKIALASIKYILLKIDINKTITFDPKKSIDFEGNTGSYLLYTYARASSILRKTKNNFIKKRGYKPVKELEKQEKELIKKLSQFEKTIYKSHKESNPSLIANYSFELSKIFNEFYHSCPVMKSEKQEFREKLVRAFIRIMKNSLNLMGIEPLEKM